MGESASPLDLSEFVIKERVGFLKLADVYDIIDPKTEKVVALARETPPTWAKIFRFFVNKQLLPTAVTITEGDENGPVLFRLSKSMSFFRKKVVVEDGSGHPVGYFRTKLFAFKAGFALHNMQDEQVAELKGNWIGWDFKFIDKDGNEAGVVTKKWSGIGRELFTSADTYMVSLKPEAAQDRALKVLLLAAALAVDVIFHEGKS